MSIESKKYSDDIVISGSGLLNSLGFGAENVWKEAVAPLKGDRSMGLGEFPVGAHLSDRKLMKVMSQADAYGLAAAEQAVKNAALAKGTVNPWRIGMYVGSQPSRASDNENYSESIRETVDESGKFNPAKFGKTMQGARPTTLLQGLPNNVLCYGSIVSDIRGPNSNYISGEVSGLMALIHGGARIKRGQVDAALVGGYQAQLDPVTIEIYRRYGWIADSLESLRPFEGAGTLIGDAAAFVALERRDHREARGNSVVQVKYLGGKIFSDGIGMGHMTKSDGLSGRVKQRGTNIAAAIKMVLEDAGVAPHSLGAVFPSASGIDCIDSAELKGLESTFEGGMDMPALASTVRLMGNAMEASGLAELSLAPWLFRGREIPEKFRVLPSSMNQKGFVGNWDQNKPVFGILRGTPTGEGVFALFEMENQ